MADWMNVDTAARVLKVTPEDAHHLISIGQLPAEHLEGFGLVVRDVGIQHYLHNYLHRPNRVRHPRTGVRFKNRK